MVPRQMYGALAYIPLGILLWSIQIGSNHGLTGLLTVIGGCGPCLVISMTSKSIEIKARSLPCSDLLSEECSAVSHAGFKKRLPSF